MSRSVTLTFACLTLILVACSDDEQTDDDGTSGGGSGGATCGTATNPTLFEVGYVTPAAGSSVPNENVIHGFTIKNAPASITMFTLAFGAEHTAGYPDPMQVFFTIMPMGADLRYEAMPMIWEHAPGEVELNIAETFKTPDECFYAFPSPLFRYSLTMGGAGGAGGAGGSTGGAGGG